jgi:hypothetical protein
VLNRRLVASACALCLALPAAAAAKPADQRPHGFLHQTAPVVQTGDTKSDLHAQSYVQAISGDTQGQLPRAIVPAPEAPQPANTPSANPTAVAGDGSTDGWQIAAIGEAALIAAFAFGSAAVIRSRRRTPHVGV